jgi:hypothetical protein
VVPVAAALGGGLSLLLVQLGGEMSGPLFFIGLRSLLAGLVLALLSSPTSSTWRSGLRLGFPLVVALGGMSVALTEGSLIEVAAILASGYSLSMLGLSGQRDATPTPMQIIGLGLALLAVALLWAGGTSAPVLIPAATAAAGFGGVIVLADRRAHSALPIPLAATALVFGGLFLTALATVAGESIALSTLMAATLLGAVFVSAVGLYLARVRSLETLGAIWARRTLAVEPLGAAAVALLLGLAISSYETAALLAATFSIWLTTGAQRAAELEVTVVGR